MNADLDHHKPHPTGTLPWSGSEFKNRHAPRWQKTSLKPNPTALEAMRGMHFLGITEGIKILKARETVKKKNNPPTQVCPGRWTPVPPVWMSVASPPAWTTVTSCVTLVSPSTLHCDNDFPLRLLRTCPHCLLPPTPFTCVFLVLGYFHLPSTYTHHTPSSRLPTVRTTSVLQESVRVSYVLYTMFF